MIKQATVEDVSSNRITKRHGLLVVTTRYYPRFLKRKLVDAYEATLAPAKDLLAEFKVREDEMGDHDAAFDDIAYESKFELSESGLAKLREYVTLSETQDVYFVCHCRLGQRCHRELLLIMARKMGAQIGRIYFDYPVFQARLPKMS